MSRRLILAALAATIFTLAFAAPVLAVPNATGRLSVSTAPYRAAQQTELAFGERSHWLQPWRGYLETVPARRVRDALGINFNVPPSRAAAVARLVAAAGFHRVRYEIGWCSMSYDNPSRIADPRGFRTVLQAFRDNGLRPLILLNAHHGCPGPLRRLDVRVLGPARAGSRTLALDAASAARVVPGYTGLDSTTTYKAAAILFTSVSGTRVTLSKPLEHDLAPGTYEASTLRYEPFRRPGDPGFATTMSGWLRYALAVAREARSVLGRRAFDVEVWNELTFGSDFLDINRYYSPAIAGGSPEATQAAILRRTIAALRSPSHHLGRIGIGNGFASQRPWDSGATSPAGLTAIDKHPYAGPIVFPRNSVFNGVRPLDALGRADGWRDSAGRWRDAFVPRYTAFFPEYYLSGIQTENLVRDLSPLTTDVYGTPHGRYTHPARSRPPQVWVTETGLDPNGVPAAVLPRFKAKEALRYATSWVNKGARALYLFAAGNAEGPWALVDESAKHGGPTLRALRRLTKALAAGRGRISRHRAVSLRAIADRHGRKQFAGDGSRGHPALYDRDVVGFFPFQVSNSRVVVAAYVMTRDLTRTYRPGLAPDDPRRYDLPPERFRLTIGGVARLGRRVSAFDPLTGRAVPVSSARRRDRLRLGIRLTDSPRLIILG